MLSLTWGGGDKNCVILDPFSLHSRLQSVTWLPWPSICMLRQNTHMTLRSWLKSPKSLSET